MNFKLNTKQLLDVLSKIILALPSKKHANENLNGVRITIQENKILFYATDLIKSIRIEEEADVNATGDILIPGKLLYEIVRKLDNEYVEFVSNPKSKTKMIVKTESSKYDIPYLSLENYPEYSKPSLKNNVLLNTEQLVSALNQVKIACSNMESRQILTGVNFNFVGKNLTLYATDSFRLAKQCLELVDEANASITVPLLVLTDLVSIITNFEDVAISFNNDALLVACGNVEYQTRLLVGSYPNVDPLIPRNYKGSIEIEKEKLIKAIDRMQAVMTTNQSTIITLAGGQDGMIVRSYGGTELSSGEELIACSIPMSGDQIHLSVNSKYLTDALKTFKDSNVRINYNDSKTPFTIESEKDNTLLQLLLPVRIQ